MKKEGIPLFHHLSKAMNPEKVQPWEAPCPFASKEI